MAAEGRSSAGKVSGSEDVFDLRVPDCHRVGLRSSHQQNTKWLGVPRQERVYPCTSMRGYNTKRGEIVGPRVSCVPNNKVGMQSLVQ